MSALAVAGIGAAADLAGSMIGASSAKRLQDDAQRWARKRYQARYQSTMRDMLKAGLNPILAGEVGGGSAPSAGISQPLDQGFLGRAVRTGVEVYRAAQEVKNLKAVEANTRQQEAESRARQDNINADTNLKVTEQGKLIEQMPWVGDKIKAEYEELLARRAAHSAKAFKDKADAGRVSGFGVSIPVGSAVDEFRRWWRERE